MINDEMNVSIEMEPLTPRLLMTQLVGGLRSPRACERRDVIASIAKPGGELRREGVDHGRVHVGEIICEEHLLGHLLIAVRLDDDPPTNIHPRHSALDRVEAAERRLPPGVYININLKVGFGTIKGARRLREEGLEVIAGHQLPRDHVEARLVRVHRPEDTLQAILSECASIDGVDEPSEELNARRCAPRADVGERGVSETAVDHQVPSRPVAHLLLQETRRWVIGDHEVDDEQRWEAERFDCWVRLRELDDASDVGELLLTAVRVDSIHLVQSGTRRKLLAAPLVIWPTAHIERVRWRVHPAEASRGAAWRRSGNELIWMCARIRAQLFGRSRRTPNVAHRKQ